jgi:hypothetical protein
MRSRLSIAFVCLLVLGIDTSIQAQNEIEQTQQADQGQEEGQKLERYRDQFVSKINEFRAGAGLSPLQRSTGEDGDICANKEAKLDFENGPHYSVKGNIVCAGHAQNSFPNGWTLDQVLNMGLQKQWNEVPPNDIHHQNLANPNYTQIGIGFYKAPDGTYWTNINFK